MLNCLTSISLKAALSPMMRRFSFYALMIVVGIFSVTLIRQNEQFEIDLALKSWREDSHAASLAVKARIEFQFAQIYQGIRTLARLPGVRKIDRHGENFDQDASAGAQEIYNNLAHNVAISEVYFLPVDFEPDAIDPNTGMLEAPIASFDERIVGRTGDQVESGEEVSFPPPEIEEIEIYEYRQMKAQLETFKRRFPKESDVEALKYPALSSQEIITCDNSQFSLSDPNDANRSGLVYSVPFYGLDGQLRGMVSAVILSNNFRKLLPPNYYMLHHETNTYRVTSNNWDLTINQPSAGSLYSDILHLDIMDIADDWTLTVIRPDSDFWQLNQISSIRRQAQMLYALVFVLFLCVSIWLIAQRRAQLRIEQLNQDLELRVAARTQDLTAAKQEAESANMTKSQFLATMSHELRTPMNGILGMTGLLLKTSLQPKQEHFATRIKQSGEALIEMLNDLLDVSKIEAGQVELEIVDFSLSRALQEVEALMQSRALGKGLAYEHRMAADIPDLIKGDFGRIKQVLFNLVGNALKFTASGAVTVDVSLKERAGDRCLIQFDVRDTGIGIAADKRERVFERFVQADSSTTRLYGGTGLGLAICRDLVTMMGGEIGVDSVLGQGSRFWFTIACEMAANQKINDEVLPIDPTLAAAPLSLRILLAEDNTINQEIAVASLEDAGHHVHVVCNGAEAVKAIQDAAYDVILMDIHMPVMDGATATKEIRRLPGPRAKTTIIALTANAMIGDREKYIAIGMDDYVTKPFDPDKLIAKIQASANNRSVDVALTADLPSSKEPESLRSAVLDPAVVEPLRLGKPALWKRLVGLYLETTPASLATMERALTEGECETVQMTAHSLKSASANMGAMRLSDLLRQLEMAAREGDLGAGTALFAEIRGEFDRVAAMLAPDLANDVEAKRSMA